MMCRSYAGQGTTRNKILATRKAKQEETTRKTNNNEGKQNRAHTAKKKAQKKSATHREVRKLPSQVHNRLVGALDVGQGADHGLRLAHVEGVQHLRAEDVAVEHRQTAGVCVRGRDQTKTQFKKPCVGGWEQASVRLQKQTKTCSIRLQDRYSTRYVLQRFRA